MNVFNVLDGIDNKIKDKGTIIRPYEPDGLSLLRHFRGTILQYVSASLYSKCDWLCDDSDSNFYNTVNTRFGPLVCAW